MVVLGASACVAQLEERLAVKRKVVGSNPIASDVCCFVVVKPIFISQQEISLPSILGETNHQPWATHSRYRLTS